jgi:UDP-glucose 4-epimerase
MTISPELSYPRLANQQLLDSYRGKRVLVTGGAGFVGSRVAHALVERGASVIVLDDLSTGRRELLPSDIDEFVEGSVTNVPIVGECVRGAHYIFHLAVRNIILSTRELRDDYAVNIGGTLNVLMAARESRELQRLVYTSSASIYGNPRALPISEDEGINILSPYAASKLAGESYCSAFFEMYQMPLTVMRYSNVFGAFQSPLNPYCGVVSKFFAACMSGRPMPIHGSGLQTRDLTYVDDVVEATLLAAVTPRAEGEAFNIGSGWEITVRDLAAAVASTVGVPCQIEFVDRRDIDNVQRRVLNIEKARRVLRWIPKLDLQRGLTLTYDWLRSGSAGCIDKTGNTGVAG